MLDQNIADLIKAVFSLSGPNQGTELADWAFENTEISGPLGLLNPAVDSLRVSNMEDFRQLVDPVLRSYGIPFYTLNGTRFGENPVTLTTGTILRELAPGDTQESYNDGFVTVARSRLAPEISADIGLVPANHFATDSGNMSFPKVAGRIEGLENSIPEFERIGVNGLTSVVTPATYGPGP